MSKLDDEVSLGEVAKKAHSSYLEGYFAQERLNIFNAFCNAPNVPDVLISLKHSQEALDTLEEITLTQIETGRLASIMIADQQREKEHG